MVISLFWAIYSEYLAQYRDSIDFFAIIDLKIQLLPNFN